MVWWNIMCIDISILRKLYLMVFKWPGEMRTKKLFFHDILLKNWYMGYDI